MKKIFYLLMIFNISLISAQSNYSDYKKEKEYEQKYLKEKWDKFYKDLNDDLITFVQYTNGYVALVQKYKSIKYVEKNSMEISKTRRDYHSYLLAYSQYFNNEQLKQFQQSVNKYNLLFNDYDY